MNTKYLFVCCALAVQGPWLPAAEPMPSRTTGKLLVLANERTLEGDVERVGDQYRVRRPSGETWVPAANVRCLCQDLNGALDYLRSQTNLRDPDERLRLARWCLAHSMREQAAAEAEEAVRLRPEHAESRRLSQNLRRAAAAAVEPTPSPVPPPAQPPSLPEPAAAVPAVEVSTECLGLFHTKVQPILMNACANCHATSRADVFKLARTFEAGNRRSAQQNLTAVLAQVNLEQPQSSPLLLKAASAHGGMAQPAFQGRQAAAYRTLEEWVRLASGKQGTAKEPQTVAAATARMEETATEKNAAEPAKPAEPPKPADAFDPAIFNRQMHGAQK